MPKANQYRRLLPVIALVAACSGDGSEAGSSVSDIDPEIPCPGGNCGNERFRRAVPSRDTVKIHFATVANRTTDADHSLSSAGVGSTQRALESLSPVLVDTEAYVADINSVIDDLFESFEDLAATSPEIAAETEHLWRVPSGDVAGFDDLLRVTAIDGESYVIELLMGESGVDADEAVAIVTGEVTLDGDDKSDFSLTIDLDAATEIIPELGIIGQIQISAMPFGLGLREIWYDFDQVGAVGGETETSITTYWIFSPTSAALEYIADLHDEEATVFVRWDEDGGRYDHHVAWYDEDYGLVDELVTNCWDALGAEVFDAYALIDQNLSYYGELDGDEQDCDFGPLDGHPSPSADFDNLPGEGEWDDIEWGANDISPDCTVDPFQVGCPPLCSEDPSDPDCIPYCDDEPDAEGCIWYCDWFDDPDYCDGGF